MTRKATKKLPAKNADLPRKRRTTPPTEKELATRIKKGEVRNPIGGLAHDPFKRQVKALTTQALAEITSMVCEMSVEEVEKIVQSKSITIAQATILRAALDASQNGRIDKFNTIVSRVVGVIPEAVQITSPDGSMSPHGNGPKLSPEELKEQINKKLDEIEAAKNASK